MHVAPLTYDEMCVLHGAIDVSLRTARTTMPIVNVPATTLLRLMAEVEGARLAAKDAADMNAELERDLADLEASDPAVAAAAANLERVKAEILGGAHIPASVHFGPSGADVTALARAVSLVAYHDSLTHHADCANVVTAGYAHGVEDCDCGQEEAETAIAKAVGIARRIVAGDPGPAPGTHEVFCASQEIDEARGVFTGAACDCKYAAPASPRSADLADLKLIGTVAPRPCPRCSGTLTDVIAKDGSCVEAERCDSCGGRWWFDPPRPIAASPRSAGEVVGEQSWADLDLDQVCQWIAHAHREESATVSIPVDVASEMAYQVRTLGAMMSYCRACKSAPGETCRTERACGERRKRVPHG